MKKLGHTTLNRFWKVIRSMIEPPPNPGDIRQRHQERLLSALLLISIFLGMLSGTIQLRTVPASLPTLMPVLGGVFILGLAYLLARTKYYTLAAIVTALTPFIAFYAALWQDPQDQSAAIFMLISVLLSSMLLNRWMTLGFAFLNLLGLVLLPVLQPAWTIQIVSETIGFHIMISALILISMWHRDRIEGDRQRELTESELKFRSIFDHSIDAIGVSRDGVHIMANPAYVSMFGCESAGRLVGNSILDLIAPAERAKIKDNIRRRSMGETVPTIYETRGVRFDGTEFDMEVHVSTYELGEKLYTVPILRDITERKRTEETLRASEEAYKLLFESNPQPMWVYDTNSLAFLAVNDEAVARYGYSREEFLRMTIKDIRPKGDIPRLLDNIAHLSGGADHAGNWRHIKKDKSVIDVEITSHMLVFEGKQAELVIANDITARIAAEKALRKSELLYRAIVEGTTDLICRFLPDTTLTFVNEAYCRYFGQSRDQLVGTRFLSMIPEADWASVQEHVASVIQNRKPVTYSHEVVNSSGEIRWQQWTDSLILNDDGDIVELQSVGRDITESHHAEEVLRAREKRYRSLAQNLPDSVLLLYDHDLRFIVADGPELSAAGFSRETLEGKTLWEALPVEDVTLLESNMRRTLAGERLTFELSHGDNLFRYYYVPILDDSRQVDLAMILGTNITRLKNTEDALKETQRRLMRAMHATRVGVWERDLRTNQEYWSDENYMLLGFRPGEIEARYENWAKALHPDDRYFAESKVVEAVNSANDLNIEFRVIRPDGSIHWINDIGSVLVDDSGHALGMYGIQIDVSERKIAEAEREKLIDELEARNIEAETLRESAASVALSLGLKETASRILDQLQRVVPYDSASVHFLTGSELQIVDGRGFPDGKDAIGMRFLLDSNDPAYPILNDGSPYILYSNVQEVSDRFKDYFHNHIFSWIAVPLQARGRLIGILTVDGFTAGKFTENHARFASTFANQVAVTLENSRLYTDLQKELGERQKAEKELRQREAILDAVAASAELLLKTSDWKVIINEILEKLGWTINASHAYLFETHPGAAGETLLSIRHEWTAPSFGSDLENPLYHDMPLHEPGLERWTELVIVQNQPFVGDRVKSSAGEMQILNERGIKAIIDMPIVVDEKWWGVIGFDDVTNDREWTNVEIDALKVAANVLSSAIQRQVYDIALMDELQKRKELIEELEHKNAELERFTYTVSHDLKSPLVTIKGFLGYIQRDLVSGNTERLYSDLERVGNATKKMEKLLWDLLELSRIGRLVGPSEEIPFEDLVREASEIVHGQLLAHRVTVRVQADLPSVFGDRQRLIEVLQNLLDNAAKYMGNQADPRIEIGLRGMEDDKFIFYVCDNGIGIGSQHHDRVFGLFNKLDAHSEGTGVGLALVKRIIEFHGGRIWIESEGNNQGTTICFTLPVPPHTVPGSE